jgi:hypothetical protein
MHTWSCPNSNQCSDQLCPPTTHMPGGMLPPITRARIKNVLPSYSPSAARAWASMTRAMVFLCICFGPVLGAALAGVTYGSKDPQVQAHGLDIRKVSSWVSVGVVAAVSPLLLHPPLLCWG